MRFLRITLPKYPRKLWVVLYWVIFPAFLAPMLPFVWPTIHKPLTILATLACFQIIISPTNQRTTVLTFIGAISLDYFIELWGDPVMKTNGFTIDTMKRASWLKLAFSTASKYSITVSGATHPWTMSVLLTLSWLTSGNLPYLCVPKTGLISLFCRFNSGARLGHLLDST